MSPLEKKKCRKLRSLVANQQGEAAGLEAKQAVVRGCKAARKRFDRLESMNRVIDAGGDAASSIAKAKRKLNDTWTKRVSNNVAGFYDPKKARVQHA